MKTLKILLAILVSFSFLFFMHSTTYAAALVKGIYLTQSTLENTGFLNYLIRESKAVGINTFIVDLEKPSKRYAANIQLLKQNDIEYVARIVVFSNGGTRDQVLSEEYREKKYALINQAVLYGASQIQLDYIRYAASNPASPQNAKDIYQVIHWFKTRLMEHDIPLQIDVFGIASFGESKSIGQNIHMFGELVDVLCPMVYPSHYEPYREHAVRPYETVKDSLVAIKAQFKDQLPFKLYPYIELSNYRYPLSHQKKMEYIYAQIRAAQDAGADGWYVWSPHNRYENLFAILKEYPVK